MLRCGCIGLTLLAGAVGSSGAEPVAGTPALLSELCVTDGSLEDAGNGRLRVNAPQMRAVLARPPADAAQLSFVYLGPTATRKTLGSGTTRVQFGLKLRAQDPCNLVYVMWRVEPESQLVVSVKSNPGEHSSSECGNRGYRNLKPDSRGSLPALASSDPHRLSAEIHGRTLEVFADGRRVWQGSLDSTAATFRGPLGVRSDNARLEFTLASGAPVAGPATPPCRGSAGQADE
jgi:hypothetical protein